MTQVVLNTTHGAIKLELDAAKAPLTVANFVEYVKAGIITVKSSTVLSMIFYDSRWWHGQKHERISYT